jgi:hypothetical protein
MRSFSVLFLILLLAAFSAVAADPAQPPHWNVHTLRADAG